MLGLIGKKIGMTQIYDASGEKISVTVVEAGPCAITSIRSKEKDGYSSLQLGFMPKKENRLTKPLRVSLNKKGLKPYSQLKEFRVLNAEKFKIGQEISVSAFKVGDIINVTGTSKGHGFAGVMKRWNKAGYPDSHGHERHRAPGSIGMRCKPGRVIPGMKMPGHFGVDTVTIKKLKVVAVRPEDNLLLIEGAIPGANNGIVYIYSQDNGFEVRPEIISTSNKTEVKKESASTVKEEVVAEVEAKKE